MDNITAFVEEYHKQLLQAVQERPTEYGYGVELVPTVVARMAEAFKRGTFNYTGLAIRRTCKAVGIKPTRTALLAYFKGADTQPKTGAACGCRPGVQRDNCPACEGTGMCIDFKSIREKI